MSVCTLTGRDFIASAIACARAFVLSVDILVVLVVFTDDVSSPELLDVLTPSNLLSAVIRSSQESENCSTAATNLFTGLLPIFENDLISRIKNPKKQTEAKNVANAIGKRCPEGYLDITQDRNGFIFYPDSTNSDFVKIKRNKFDDPLTTLLKINKFLKNL